MNGDGTDEYYRQLYALHLDGDPTQQADWVPFRWWKPWHWWAPKRENRQPKSNQRPCGTCLGDGMVERDAELRKAQCPDCPVHPAATPENVEEQK